MTEATDTSTDDRLADESRQEWLRWQRFCAVAEEFADALADDAVWRRGDGAGGAAMMHLEDLLQRRGVCDPQRLSLNFHPKITKTTRARIAYRDGHVCQWCGSISNLQIDHKIPCSRGGTDDDANLWVLCRGCNRTKNNRTVGEWLSAGGVS